MSQDKYADRLLRPETGPRLLPWSTRPGKDRRLRTTLLVGHPLGVEAVHRRLLEQPRPDHRVIGCCLPAPGRGPVPGLPVLGTPDDVVDVVHRYAVDTVAVLPSSGLDGAALRRLERELAPTRADLVLAPAGDRGPRSHAPEPPSVPRRGLRGVDGLGKACFDRAAAAVLLVLLAPVLLAVAVGVKATTQGPVFVRRVRVGRHGRLFSALAFRSAGSDGLGTTRLGAILRRLSLDELPRLFNVLKGDMSLVGPRPRLPGWNHLGVRPPLSVRPGLIGPAQVGGAPGRVLLTDVDYVENWSPLLDLTILRKTLAAVLRGYAAP